MLKAQVSPVSFVLYDLTGVKLSTTDSIASTAALCRELRSFIGKVSKFIKLRFFIGKKLLTNSNVAGLEINARI
jgi:hypothetical protein